MSDERWAEVHAAKDTHCAALLAKPGVNYVGVSLKQTAGRQTDTPTIVVAVQSKLPLGPNVRVESGETFTSFRTFELLPDSQERERRGLALRRMYRTIARGARKIRS